jgi:hypothetical protein
MCEVLGAPSASGSGRAVFVPPPCPVPGACLPSVADPRLGRRYVRRSERVQRTLFPRLRLRLCLPAEFGGYGYTGRGLALPVSMRKRLALLVSRGLNPSDAERWLGKVPFQEAGLFARPLVQGVPRPGVFYRLRKRLPVVQDYLDPLGSRKLLLRDLVSSVEELSEHVYRHVHGYEGPRKIVRAGHAKTRRTKPRALFKGTLNESVRPLTRSHGLASLRRLAEVFASTPVRVRDDIPAMIRGRTTAREE